MNKASFTFKGYKFERINIDYTKEINYEDLDIEFIPRGIFDESNQNFKLNLNFKAFNVENEDSHVFIDVDCEGIFKFNDAPTLEDIPEFFYRNAIAIFFPYLRAYISIVTNQANIPGLILPTLNLSALAEPLKISTKAIKEN